MLSKKKTVAVLGSTGSIGRSSLKILSKYSNLFKVELLSCNDNKTIIEKQINKFLPKFVIINNFKNFNYFKKKYKKKIKFFQNLNDFKKFNHIKFDNVILGISSIYGLEYAFYFIKVSNKLIIANKETIVCGGKFFLFKAKSFGCNIVSIDSEHFCLNEILKKNNLSKIDKVYLTASGGPFLNKRINEVSKINYKYALKHPKWKMGKKISIDSSTLANKGLEVIEASYLFNLKADKIKIKIHKESNVHSVVIFKNGLVHLVAHNTSMLIPIENVLVGNKILYNNNNFFSQKKTFKFTFDEINLKKFKMVSMAYKSLKYGPRCCIFYNVVNDYLVDLYLKDEIFYYEITHKLNKVINNTKLLPYFKKNIKSFNDIKETINLANFYAKKI